MNGPNIQLAPLAKFSNEARLRQRQIELGVSGAFIAALGDILPSQLTEAYKGRRTLPNEVALELLEITKFLLEARDAASPFRVPMDNAFETKVFYKTMVESGVTPDRIREYVQRMMSEDGSMDGGTF